MLAKPSQKKLLVWFKSATKPKGNIFWAQKHNLTKGNNLFGSEAQPNQKELLFWFRNTTEPKGTTFLGQKRIQLIQKIFLTKTL